jgi:hypothetical protein
MLRQKEAWENSAKISHLRNALYPKFKFHLIGCFVAKLQIYAAFAIKCEEISNQMEFFRDWKTFMSSNY